MPARESTLVSDSTDANALSASLYAQRWESEKTDDRERRKASTDLLRAQTGGSFLLSAFLIDIAHKKPKRNLVFGAFRMAEIAYFKQSSSYFSITSVQIVVAIALSRSDEKHRRNSKR